MNADTLLQHPFPVTRSHAFERLLRHAGRTVHHLRTRLQSARPAPEHFSMADDETQWVRHPMGRELRCLEGRLWLTVDRCPLDIFLDPGDVLRLNVDRPLLIQALGPARCVLD